MKKLYAFIFLISVLMITFFSINVKAMELRSVDAILADIRQNQNISNTDTIDISKVTLVLLEELGDSVMENVIGNSTIHERLDDAFGKDGSISLTNTHLRVGYNYLAGVPITMMTFMGTGGMMAYGSLMGGYGYLSQNGYNPNSLGMMGNYGWIWIIVSVLAFISLIALGIHIISRLTRKQMVHPKEFVSDNRALQLLKERYARGEITRDEYTRMYEDLK